ncbi:MAG: hypothetical protein SGPRY_012078 [Prymnesium sp.]
MASMVEERIRHLEALVDKTDEIVSRAHYQTQIIKRMLDRLRSVDFCGSDSDILEGTYAIIARAHKTLGELIDSQSQK